MSRPVARTSPVEPRAPFLVVRSGTSFWIEREGLTAMRATLQAFREGCFDRAECIDEQGGLWPVLEAVLDTDPSSLERLLPSKLLPVTVRLGPRRSVDIMDVVTRLVGVLRSGSDFSDYLGVPVPELISRLEACGSIPEVMAALDEAGV